MKKTIQLALAILLTTAQGAFAQKSPGLALTPPMGWNSWNTFATDISDQLVREVADSFVKFGLKDAGYEYIVLDDGWMLRQRDAKGNLVPDPEKFPLGMKALVEYVHAQGLKFGIYNCAGDQTCAGYPGSRGFEYQDARLYAEWGVDFLKYDWCNTKNLNALGAYETMRDAIAKSGRPMVFSLCEWGDNQPWTWAKEVGHMWRVTGDIINCWDCEFSHGDWSSWGLWSIIHMRKDIRKYSGPGHWNDFDMMEVGNGFTPAEDRVHFVMWSMLASPLIMGNDVRTMSRETRELLTHEGIIAINQDSLGVQAFRYMNENNVDIWVKPLQHNEWAVAFVNHNKTEVVFRHNWKKHPMADGLVKRALETDRQNFRIREVIQRKELGTTNKELEVKLGSHDVLLLRISPN